MKLFEQISSVENLYESWREFRCGKRSKPDVQDFERHLEQNLFRLHDALRHQTYRHSPYASFSISDPKLRRIHKATVSDRIVHRALSRMLMPIFNPRFIHDSYACRPGKGTHAAVLRLERFARTVSKNFTRPCIALKCDVRKFFDSIDHTILLDLIRKTVSDPQALWLIGIVVESFTVESSQERERESRPHGLPLGNLTSQLFANIYLNELDQFVKHTLRMKCYLRYCDDFVILHNNRNMLEQLIEPLRRFLDERLCLTLHPKKTIIRKLTHGIDFLGYVTLPNYRVLRTSTKRRMLQHITPENLPSYLGLLKHCRGYALERELYSKLLKPSEQIPRDFLDEWEQ